MSIFVELLLSVGETLKPIANAAAWIGLLFLVVSFFMGLSVIHNPNEAIRNAYLNVSKGLQGLAKLVLVLSVFVLAVPRAQDLWTIRISMIKLYLASPDNIQKSVEVIENVAKKLECKYLGGCEEKK